MAKFYLIFILECLFLLSGLTCIIWFIFPYIIKSSTIDFKSYMLANLGLIIGFCVSAIGFVVRTIQHLYILTPKVKYDLIRTEQINYWLKQNTQYNNLKDELNELEKEKKKNYE